MCATHDDVQCIGFTTTTHPASSQVLSITTDQDENITINEGEKSFIVFNFTYYGVNGSRLSFAIFTDKDQQGVPFNTFTSGRSLQYANGSIHSDEDRNLISEFHVLLIYGTEEVNQSIIKCRYGRNIIPCNISILVTVRPAGSEGKHLGYVYRSCG